MQPGGAAECIFFKDHIRYFAAFRSLSLNEKRRQVAALQKLPPFQVKWLIAFSFNLHSLQLSRLWKQ
jgi:hypothetical protein